MSDREGETSNEAGQLAARRRELELEVRALESKVTALRGLEALLGSILDAMPDFVVKISPEGTIQFVNRVAPGLDASQVVGASFYEFISPEWRERAQQAVARAVETGAMVAYESEGLGAHGETRRYFSRLAPLRRGEEVEALVLIATDVTDLLEARSELRQRTEQLDLAADATGLGFWSWERGESIHWDEATHRMFGCESVPESLDAFFEMIHPDDRADVRGHLLAALDSGVIGGTEYRIVLPDGQTRWIFAKGRVDVDAAGQPVRIVGGVIDVSERRKLQDDLIQARKLEAVGQLAAGIAHNFNNMLTVMLSTMELALKRSPVEVTALLEEGRSAALRAAKMVRQLMLFSGRGQRAQRREEDLEAIVRRTVEMCRATFPREIALELAPAQSLPAVRCDAAQIEQALLNVLLNARDALEGIEGRPRAIRIRVRSLEGPPAGGDATSPWTSVEVVDTGTGMTESVLRRAMEPFFTTKGPGQGTGLGLATTYAIVKDHGGRVQLESVAGVGTTVTLSFPALAHPPRVRDVVASPEPPRGHGERVLLVDDEPLIRESVSRILKGAGYVVECAANGEEALHVVHRSPGELDLVLLDQSMPGLGGRAVLRELRENVPSLAVVCFSGYAASLEGADAVLEKPVTADQLLATLREVLDRRGRAGRPPGP